VNRRTLLKSLGIVIGGIVLNEAVPLGRVWSFPSEIKCLNLVEDFKYTKLMMYRNIANLGFTPVYPTRVVGDLTLMENEHLPRKSFYWLRKPSTLLIEPKNLELARQLLGKT
jgi:hypothetical protein